MYVNEWLRSIDKWLRLIDGWLRLIDRWWRSIDVEAVNGWLRSMVKIDR